jgi:hypothetical protein
MDPGDPPARYYVDSDGDDTANGSEESPWRTITHALLYAPEATSAFPVTIQLGAGEYEEKVILRPHFRLSGAGPAATTIKYYQPSDNNPVVVTGAEGAVLEGCTVTIPSATTAIVELLHIQDVSMRVINVVLDGKDGIHVTGAFVTGSLSSNSLIRNCVIQRAEYGVVAVNSGVNITRNLFDSIFQGAIFIRPPEAKEDSGEQLPLLGSTSNIAETGFNRFRQSEGFLVLNMTSGETTAQYNDWGVYTDEQISAGFTAKAGTVKYQPYVGKSIVPGSVAVELLDKANRSPIAVARNPQVKLGTSIGSHDASSNLFIFTTIPAGYYTCEASAAGYTKATLNITAVAGDITAETLQLDPVPAEGESPEGSVIAEGESMDEGQSPNAEGEIVMEGESSEGDTSAPQTTRRGCFSL